MKPVSAQQAADQREKPGTVAQAAAVLGLTPQRVHQLLDDGQLELAFKAPGLRGAKYVTAESVKALKEKRDKK